MTSDDYGQKQALFSAPPAAGWELFRRAPAVRFAVSTPEGPLLRSLSTVVLDGRLCFHGSSRGQKSRLLGRSAVASYEEVVAQVASYWVHPELACPASTYYLSVLAEGTIEPVESLARRARILSALMERFQPEGGHAPIEPDDARYRKVLETLVVAELVPSRINVKHKLGQHRTRAQIERILSGLWQRGQLGDLRAVRLIRAAHPERPEPPFLHAPAGLELCVAPDEDDALAVAGLLGGQYWTTEFSRDRMARAQLGSSAWVVARSSSTGELVGSARAVSDGARYGYILDVIVSERYRGQGIGARLMELLLAHPALRSLLCIRLRTRDAHSFYTRFGFTQGQLREELELLRTDPRAQATSVPTLAGLSLPSR